MTILQFANNVSVELAAPTPASGGGSTAFMVFPGGGAEFPALSSGQAYYATLIKAGSPTVLEIVLVTARSGDTMTALRGQDGTTALAWAVNDLMQMRPNAAAMRQFVQPDELPASLPPTGAAGGDLGGTYPNPAVVGPAATETLAGIAEVATQAETDAVTLDTVNVTPKKLGNGFSFNANGIRFPSWMGGFMAQWGSTAALATGTQTANGTITFGTAFGTACYWCGGFPDDVAQVGGWSPITCIFNPPSTSACNFVADTGGGSAQPITNPNVHIRFLAVGKA